MFHQLLQSGCCRMSRVFRCMGSFHFLFVSILLLLLTGAAGAQCDSILRQGVFNSIVSNTGLTIQQDLFKWLSITTDEQFNSAQQSGLKFSATIGGLPFDLNGSNSINELHRLQTAINQGEVQHLFENEFMQIAQLSVAPEIVNAWLQCIQQTGTGLVCSLSFTSDHLATFSARFIPNSPTDLSPTVLAGGFQVSAGGTFSGSAFSDGNEVPFSNTTVLINRPGNDAVAIVLNTTKGSCVQNIPAVQPPPPPSLQLPSLQLRIFSTTGAVANHPEATVSAPPGYKVLSGGFNLPYTGFGNMGTCSMPLDAQHWIAKGKDHIVANPAPIEVSAVFLFDPNDLWDVVYNQITVGPAEHVSGTVSVPSGYTLVGGGACANWISAGLLLTDSHPLDSTTWTAAAKDQDLPESATLTIVAVGIRPRNGVAMPATRIFSSLSPLAQHPSTSVAVDSAYVMLGGGCQDEWSGAGNLLTACLPVDLMHWAGTGKDHIEVSPANLAVYAIGIQLPAAATCAYSFSPPTLSLQPQAQTVTVNLVTSPGCVWNVDSAPLFTKILSAGPITTAGSIVISVDANTTGTGRTDVVKAAGQTLPIFQSGMSCGPFTLSQTQLSFPAAGGNTDLTVTGDIGCPFAVTGLPTWISVASGGSGIGSGTIHFQAAPANTSRSATFTLAGIAVTVTQTGLPPEISVGLSSQTVQLKAGTTGQIHVSLSSSTGVTDPATLSCSGLPQGASCMFSQIQLRPGSSATLNISTSAPSSASAGVAGWSETPRYLQPSILQLLGLLALSGTIMLCLYSRKGRWARACLLGCVLAAGCGGGGQAPVQQPTATTGTPAGTYQVTITATTVNGLSTSTKLTLIIN